MHLSLAVFKTKPGRMVLAADDEQPYYYRVRKVALKHSEELRKTSFESMLVTNYPGNNAATYKLFPVGFPMSIRQ